MVKLTDLGDIKLPQAASAPPILQFTVIGAGGLLVLSAVYNLDPIGALKNLFTGKNPLDAKYGAKGPPLAFLPNAVPPGGSAGGSETYGSGYWYKSDPGPGWQWIHMSTWAEITAGGGNKDASKGIIPAPPKGAKSPPWRWNPGEKQWIDTSKLTSDQYNPKKTPGSTSSNNSAGYTGGSDPIGTQTA